jgi:peptidoglycan/xylan/chitin deacetylase (PgdA/CDA1 family)
MNLLGKNVQKVLSIGLSLGLMFTVVAPIIPKASASTTAAPRISFTFDDGLTSAYTEAAPTLAKYGYSGVDYVTSGCIGTTGTCPAEPTNSYMTWAQVSALKSTYNWEIAAHTVDHPLLASTDPTSQPTALTPAQVTSELTDSVAAIKANSGIVTTDFATPYGDWNFPILAQIAKYNASHRGFADSIDQGTTPTGIINHANVFPYNDYLLYDLPVQSGVTVAQVESYIDQTIASGNQWLVLTFHDIRPIASTDPAAYQYNTADLDAIAAYVKSKNLQVVNIADGLVSSPTNLLTNPSFDTALSTNTADPAVWSTDSPTLIQQDTAGNGNFPSPTNSVSLTGGTANAQLYSPQVIVDPTQTYIIKGYLYSQAITVASGHEIAYYIQEFDAAGVALPTLQYKKSETTVWLESMNFEYKPSSAAVKSARIELVVTANSGVKAYVDNFQWFSESPSAKAGDVNGDNLINALDLSLIAANWNHTGVTRAQGDLNGDGIVNALDLSILATNWGK